MNKEEKEEDIKLTFFESWVTTNYFGRGVGLEMLTRDELKKYLEDISDTVQTRQWVALVIDGYLGQTDSWSEEYLISSLQEVKKDIRLVQKRLAEGATTEDLSVVQKEKEKNGE